MEVQSELALSLKLKVLSFWELKGNLSQTEYNRGPRGNVNRPATFLEHLIHSRVYQTISQSNLMRYELILNYIENMLSDATHMMTVTLWTISID